MSRNTSLTKQTNGLHNRNPLGSDYAGKFGGKSSNQLLAYVEGEVRDGRPKQFLELTLLQMGSLNGKPEQVMSDEFEYDEHGTIRKPLYVKTGASAGAAPVITITNVSEVAENTIYALPDGTNVTLENINNETGQVTVKPQIGETVPTIAAGVTLANITPIEADGTDDFAQYVRAEYTTRSNYVMFMSKGRIYGRVEYAKIKNQGRQKAWLAKEWELIMQDARVDISNAIWMSKKGARMTKDGIAKQTNGIYHTLRDAGAPVIEATMATAHIALQSLAEVTEFGVFGETRFFFAPNRLINIIGENYKGDKTRYTPNDRIARLGLNQIDIGSSKIVLVPYNRFNDPASFPEFFSRSGFLIDFSNIKTCEFFPMEIIDGFADERGKGGKKAKIEMGITYSIGLKFHQPESSGMLTITDM